MKIFVATIIARIPGWETPLAECREVDVANISEEDFSLEEEEAIRDLLGRGPLPRSTELSSSLAEGALGIGTTEEEAKKAAVDEWCRQEANMIEWKE